MAVAAAIGSQLNHAGAAAMAKPDANLPRRRGAPRKDYEPVLRDVLRLWLEIGGPRRSGLDRAVRGTITEAYARKVWGCEAKSLRAQINRLRRHTCTIDLLRHAAADAKHRGAAMPQWAEIELAELERNEAERLAEWERYEAEHPGALTRGLSGLSLLLPRYLIDTKLARTVEHVRRLVTLYRTFDDLIPADTPASVGNELYQAMRPLVAEMMRVRNSQPEK
jgi:hypothetical protein